MAFVAEAAACIIWKYNCLRDLARELVKSIPLAPKNTDLSSNLVSQSQQRNLVDNHHHHHHHDWSNRAEDERGCVETSRSLRQGYPGDRDPRCSIYVQRRRKRVGKDRHRGRFVSLFEKRRAVQQYSHNEQVAFTFLHSDLRFNVWRAFALHRDTIRLKDSQTYLDPSSKISLVHPYFFYIFY